MSWKKKSEGSGRQGEVRVGVQVVLCFGWKKREKREKWKKKGEKTKKLQRKWVKRVKKSIKIGKNNKKMKESE